MSDLVLENVSKIYESAGKTVTVFENLNLTLKDNSFLAVKGVSGIGKSTLLNLIGLLDTPTGGTIKLGNVYYDKLTLDEKSDFRNSKLGFVFQFHHLLSEFTVLENVVIPFTIGGKSFKEGNDLAREILEMVGLSERLDHYPSQLSGGEQQRTAIARALINSPEILLMDEPTGNLDPFTGDVVMDYIDNLRKNKSFSCVIVTHNMKIAKRCDKIFSMGEDGV
jgi:lipoprotein-releasing system ATP-binding protein